jgi:hypothetical protein
VVADVVMASKAYVIEYCQAGVEELNDFKMPVCWFNTTSGLATSS